MGRDTRLTRLFGDGPPAPAADDGKSGFAHDGWRWVMQGGPLGTAPDLYAFRHRAFSPLPGRWAPQDPLGYADGIDRYEYPPPAPNGEPHG